MQEFCNFLNFCENISTRFYHFFMKSFLVASSYQYLAVDIKNLITSALVTVSKRPKVPIKAVFMILCISRAIFLAQAFKLGH